MMAEGGYDPTKENETPWEDHGIDNDGDDNVDLSRIPITDEEEEVWHDTPGATSTPYRPGAAYHPGEEREMTHLPPEAEGLGDTVPLLESTDFSERITFINKVKQFIKRKFPRADFDRIDVGIGSKEKNEGRPVAIGPKWGETLILKKDGDVTAAFLKQYSDVLGPSAENILAEDQMTLRDTQQRVTEAQQLEKRLNKEAEKQQQEAQERQRLETQLEQINQRINNMEQAGGTEMEKQMETDRLKRESAKLKRDIKGSRKGVCTNSKRTRQGCKRSCSLAAPI